MGTILAYKGAISNIPDKWALCDGNHGTPNLSGRFLEGVISSPGSMKLAGLPNVTVTFGFQKDGLFRKDIVSGAFTGLEITRNKYPSVADSTADLKSLYYRGITIDLSQGSSVYRNDCTTVQPNSYTVLYIMKIKA